MRTYGKIHTYNFIFGSHTILINTIEKTNTFSDDAYGRVVRAKKIS